ncbi:MAG: GatB/YqeY domain-containing protein [Anaerolineae bacterium]|nr:GatB/YqeY domain-containing protein [Anaerolineae bacterium]
MHPKEQIQADLKEAMRAGDTRRREALRLLMAAFKQVEVDRRIELSVDDALGILMSEAKKRREAIAEMSGAGRTELAAQEQYELDLIESYLPRQLDRAELEPIVREAIAEVGATTPKDMGQVMKLVMARVKGQADGKLVNTIVRELLS